MDVLLETSYRAVLNFGGHSICIIEYFCRSMLAEDYVFLVGGTVCHVLLHLCIQSRFSNINYFKVW